LFSEGKETFKLLSFQIVFTFVSDAFIDRCVSCHNIPNVFLRLQEIKVNRSFIWEWCLLALNNISKF